jgi:hypothetical protein
LADRLAQPFKYALTWWIIAELARRHPDLRVEEWADDFGLASTLELVHPTGAPHIYINRLKKGIVHAVNEDKRDTDWPLEILVQRSADELVRMIEEAADLPHPSHAPPTTPRTLTFRIAADIAMTTVHDHRYFSAYDAKFDQDVLKEFPLVHERDSCALEAAREGGRFWILSDNKNLPVAVLDTEGYAYTSTMITNLSTAYAENNRSLHRTTAAIFADLL